MADNLTLNAGSGGAVVATDDITSVHYQIIKLAYGALDSATLVTTSAGLPVAQQGTWILGANSGVDIGDVTLNGPVGGGLETTAIRVTVANDSTGLLSIDDNAGSLTVDNGGTFAVQVDGNALTALQLIDDIVHSGDAVLSKYAVMGAVLDDTTTVAVTENQAQSLRMSTRRALLVEGVASGTNVNVAVASIAAGTSNIGDVDVLTIAAGDNNIGNVDVVTLPALAAGTNLVGIASVGMNTTTCYDGTTALTPKFAIIDAATSGDNTLVAAVASKKLRVQSAFLVAAGTVVTRFESGAAGTALTGQMNLVANTGYVLPFNPFGWFETAAATLLNLELSAAVSVDGCLQYIEV